MSDDIISNNGYSGTILGKKIYLSARGGAFFSGLISGPRGIGKSSYALRSLHFALLSLGYSDAEAWEICLRSIKFKLFDVVQFLESAVSSDARAVCLIWDDVRISASGSSWFQNPKLVVRLVAVLDTVRSSICSMVLTSPSSSGLLSVLNSFDDHTIKVSYSSAGGWYRTGKGYITKTLPSGMRRIYRSWEDTFSCYLPNVIFERYNKMRKDALKDALKDLSKEVKE